MPPAHATPEGLRPPAPDDAERVLEVVVARDVEDVGRPDFTLEDIRGDWAGPDLDLRRDAWVVEQEAGRLAAYAILLGDDAIVLVRPEACGDGLGNCLRELAEARARERGTRVLRQFVPSANAPARALLLEAGYWPAQHYFRMRRDLAGDGERDGAVRPFDPERDEAGVHALVQSALSEVEGYVAQPLERWRETRIGKAGWDPALWLVLHDDQGLAGAVLGERWEDGVGYVEALAVAPRARGCGHGRALLLAAFAAFAGAGLRAAELPVHGANAGAARLYESVGMTPVWQAERWEKALGDE